MNFNTSYSENFYFFTSKLTEENRKSIIKFKNISIIYEGNEASNHHEDLIKIIKFCKEKKIKIYYKDDIKKAYKLNFNGVFLSSNNKRISILNNDYTKKNNFKIIGGAHNQWEYFLKKRQGSNDIFFSPIFKNNKYSQNRILNTCKFNLIANEWKCNLFALGGINSSNFKKILMTKSRGIGFISFINDPKIKKPVYFFQNRRALNNV
jgi:thiamine-phosphate pyrophosphorylase